MGNIGLVSMLSAFATLILIVAFIIEITILIIGTLFEKKIKKINIILKLLLCLQNLLLS